MGTSYRASVGFYVAPPVLSGGVVDSTSVSLSWTASSATDGRSIARYVVLRGGAFVTSVTGLSTTVTGLTAATQYSFTVVAVASNGQQSAESNTVVLTTTSGTYVHGASLTITGSGFGSKAVAAPLVWAPMDGTSDPSALGRVTAWTTVQAMGYAAGEGYAGGGSMKATDSSGSWVAGVIASGVVWNAYGQRMYCFRRVKRNFDIPSSRNWKIIRFWPAAQTTPDWFIQAGNANLNVEGVDGSDTYPYDAAITSPISGGNIAAVRGSANVWRTEEILMKANSAASAYDGEFYHYVVGSGLVGVLPHVTYQNKTIRLRSGDGETNMTLGYPIHGVVANETFPSNYRYWVDDVYLDTDWARVMIGNAATYSACTFIAPQPATAWSSTSVTVSLNLAGFPSGDTRYLHVIDNTNTVRQTMNIGVHP